MKRIKKIIDRIIEKIYTKRFPERCGRFPLPDIIRVNQVRFAPVTLNAVYQFDKRNPDKAEIDIVQNLLIEKILKSNDFSEFVSISQYEDIFTGHLFLRAELKVLKSEG